MKILFEAGYRVITCFHSVALPQDSSSKYPSIELQKANNSHSAFKILGSKSELYWKLENKLEKQINCEDVEATPTNLSPMVSAMSGDVKAKWTNTMATLLSNNCSTRNSYV